MPAGSLASFKFRAAEYITYMMASAVSKL